MTIIPIGAQFWLLLLIMISHPSVVGHCLSSYTCSVCVWNGFHIATILIGCATWGMLIFYLFQHAAAMYLVPMQILSMLVYVYFIVGNRLWITCSGEFHSTMRDYFFGKKKKDKGLRVFVIPWLLLHCNNRTIRLWINLIDKCCSLIAAIYCLPCNPEKNN